jgi:hypothetical protein
VHGWKITPQMWGVQARAGSFCTRFGERGGMVAACQQLRKPSIARSDAKSKPRMSAKE